MNKGSTMTRHGPGLAEKENSVKASVLGKEWVDITKMPLSSVPLSKERKGFFTQEQKETANHELNHAIAAKSRNIYPDLISVVQEGNVLGKNTFSGWIDPESWKVIAAGGAVELADGTPASGFGSDMFSAKFMQFMYGGMNFDQAKEKAKAIVKSYEKKVLDRASEIIAFMKVVNGNQLNDVLKRAEYELAMEKGEQILAYMYVPNKAEELYGKKQETNQNEEKTTIIEYMNGNQAKLTYKNGDKVERVITYCGACHGIGGHNKDCSYMKKGINDKIEFADGSKKKTGNEEKDAQPNLQKLQLEGLIFSSYTVKIDPKKN